MEDQPLPLDYKEQPNPPPRPTWQHEAVRRAAAEACLDGEVIFWAGVDYKPAEREEWIADLAGVMGKTDGYEAAKHLDDHHQWGATYNCDPPILDSDAVER